MFHPDYSRIIKEYTHTAHETRNACDMIELSTTRAAALLDMACLYENTNGRDRYCVPNGKFTDAECVLWELFLKAFRAGKEYERSLNDEHC